MKRIIATVLLIFVVLFIGGCVRTDTKTAESDEPDRFVINNRQKVSPDEKAIVITDKVTGVQYLFVDGFKAGGLCVMVDADGKPLVDKGE